jgi:hypothetical protein
MGSPLRRNQEIGQKDAFSTNQKQECGIGPCRVHPSPSGVPMTTPPKSISIEEMTREEAIAHLCGLAATIGEKAFVEVFTQTTRKPATFVGLEVKDKDAGLLLLANLAKTAQHITLLPAEVA